MMEGSAKRYASAWGPTAKCTYRNSQKAADLSGETLVFATAKGETIVVVPRGSTTASVKMI